MGAIVLCRKRSWGRHRIMQRLYLPSLPARPDSWVVFDGLCHREVHDEANVGLVYAHAKSHRANYDADFPRAPEVVHPAPVIVLEVGVVVHCRNPEPPKFSADLLCFLLREAVHQPAWCSTPGVAGAGGRHTSRHTPRAESIVYPAVHLLTGLRQGAGFLQHFEK